MFRTGAKIYFSENNLGVRCTLTAGCLKLYFANSGVVTGNAQGLFSPADYVFLLKV